MYCFEDHPFHFFFFFSSYKKDENSVWVNQDGTPIKAEDGSFVGNSRNVFFFKKNRLNCAVAIGMSKSTFKKLDKAESVELKKRQKAAAKPAV